MIVEPLNINVDYNLIGGFLRGLKPDPLMTVSEWADAKRFLPPESARPGPFKMSLTPYNKEISDRLSVSDPAQMIILKKSSQVGATETGNNWLGYVIDLAPGNFLYVMPTDALMKKTSKTRIQKMIDTTPSLTVKVRAQKSRDNANTMLEKYFEGGGVTMIGANSPVGLASTPIRFVYMDEIDRYPMNVGGEGSALSLAETRTVTYGSSKKIFLTSTPTLKGKSAIDNEFQETGQRHYYVPCPYCNHMQVLHFENLKYTIKEWDKTCYECEGCHELIPERFKPSMLASGKWRAHFPENEDGLTYGYHINALYSPYGMYSWGMMAKEYEKAKKDTSKMISFVNTKIGEVYEGEKGDVPEWEKLYDRAHNEDNDCERNKPFKWVTFITAGIDVQGDRIELEIVGWGKNKESQSIDYRVLTGNPQSMEVWKELEKVVNETWEREDNMIMPIRFMAIDSGNFTSYVYDFVKRFSSDKVISIKGDQRLDTYIRAPRSLEYSRAGKKLGKIKVWGIGVGVIKGETYGFLKQEIDRETGEIPFGYCHFPTRDTTYFRGITAEELISVVNKKGYPENVWHKKYKRNEPLDCRVYARAAAYIVGMDRWDEEQWEEEWKESAWAKEETGKESEEQVIEVRKSPFWNNRRR